MFTARVLDDDPDGSPPWLATQFVSGPALRSAVQTNGPLSPQAQHRLARELAEALSAIHAAGLVHRDLKPANVLLSPAGAKVIDFGIAHALDSTRLTSTGMIIGHTGLRGARAGDRPERQRAGRRRVRHGCHAGLRRHRETALSAPAMPHPRCTGSSTWGPTWAGCRRTPPGSSGPAWPRIPRSARRPRRWLRRCAGALWAPWPYP
jgi:serine/threonine protein kinase